MPGLIIGKKEFQVPGLEIVNYYDFRKLKLIPGEDMRRRHTRWVRSIFLHNTKNIETIVVEGTGPETRLEDRIARLWATDARHAGAHLCVDWDCTVACLADLLYDAAYHAGQVNEVSIGIEIYEDHLGRIYAGQLAVVHQLVRWLCARFCIQMQMPPRDFDGTIPRLLRGGGDCVGVFGHCHACAKKRTDPGRSVFHWLAERGFREFDFCNDEDKVFWYDVQKKYGLAQDGVPGPITCDALRADGAGYRQGLWVYPEKEG